MFTYINNWCETSGATLFTTQYRYIHICRLKNCRCEIRSSNFQLTKVDKLRLLGIIINKRYNWKDHVEQLLSSISQRLKNFKRLSNPKWNCNAINITSITKALILSKMNYGLQFFGYAPKSQKNKINSVINSCIRTSIGALRSTPVANTRYETNIRSLDAQRDILTIKLFRILLYNEGNPLKQIAKKNKPIQESSQSTLYYL